METKEMTELLKKWSKVVESLGIKEYPKMVLFSRFSEHLQKQGINNIYDNLKILKSLNLQDKYVEFKSDLKNHVRISLNMDFNVVNEFKEKTGFNIYESSKSLLISKLINKINLDLDTNEMIYINYFINNHQSDDMVREISPNYEVCRSEKTVFKIVFKGEKSELHRFIFKGLKPNTKIVIQPDEIKVFKLYENTDVDKKEKDKYKTITYISLSRIDGHPIFYHDYIMSKETIKSMLSTLYKIPLELETGKIDIKLTIDDFDIEIVPMLEDIMNADIDELKKMTPPKEIARDITKNENLGCSGPDDSGFGPGICGDVDKNFPPLEKLNDVSSSPLKAVSEKIMSNFRFHPDVYNKIKQKSEKNYLSMTDYIVQLVLKDDDEQIKESETKTKLSLDDITKISKSITDLAYTGVHMLNFRPKEDDIVTRIDEKFVPRKDFKYEKNQLDFYTILNNAIKHLKELYPEYGVGRIITNKLIFSHMILMESIEKLENNVTFHNIPLEYRVDLDHNYIYFKNNLNSVIYLIEIYDPLGCYLFDLENMSMEKRMQNLRNSDGIPLKSSDFIKSKEYDNNIKKDEVLNEINKDDRTTFYFLKVGDVNYPILEILEHPNNRKSNPLYHLPFESRYMSGNTFKFTLEIPLIYDGNDEDIVKSLRFLYTNKKGDIFRSVSFLGPKVTNYKDKENRNTVLITFDQMFDEYC